MNFFYEAVDENGNTVVGKMDAANEQEAKRSLMLQGYRPRALVPNPSAASVEEAAPIPPPLPSLPDAKEEPGLATGHSVAPTRLAQEVGATAVSLNRPVTAQASQTASHNFTGMHSLNPAPALAQGSGGARAGSITLAGNAARAGATTSGVRGATPNAQRLTPSAVYDPNASKLGGVPTRDLMFFFQQLTSLVKSGMTIYTALENLGPRTKNANLSKVAREMAEAAHAGRRISEVMGHYPRIFPGHITGMVGAGELGGFLEIALAEIAQNYEQDVALYRGAWLPKLLTSQALLGIPVVIPVGYLFDHGFDIMAGVKDYLIHEAIIFPIFLLAYFLLKILVRYVQLPHLRHFRDYWALRLPPFGSLSRQAALFNFVKMLRKLYHAGVAPIHAWEGAMYTASNVVIRDKLADAYHLMQRGSSLADAFTATGLFADNVEQLMITGQHSGEVVESLDRAAVIYDERVQEARNKSRMLVLRLSIWTMVVVGLLAMGFLTKSYMMGLFRMVFPEEYGGSETGIISFLR
jgi:type II secretory pathway component PulF